MDIMIEIVNYVARTGAAETHKRVLEVAHGRLDIPSMQHALKL